MPYPTYITTLLDLSIFSLITRVIHTVYTNENWSIAFSGLLCQTVRYSLSMSSKRFNYKYLVIESGGSNDSEISEGRSWVDPRRHAPVLASFLPLPFPLWKSPVTATGPDIVPQNVFFPVVGPGGEACYSAFWAAAFFRIPSRTRFTRSAFSNPVGKTTPNSTALAFNDLMDIWAKPSSWGPLEVVGGAN